MKGGFCLFWAELPVWIAVQIAIRRTLDNAPANLLPFYLDCYDLPAVLDHPAVHLLLRCVGE